MLEKQQVCVMQNIFEEFKDTFAFILLFSQRFFEFHEFSFVFSCFCKFFNLILQTFTLVS
jgi:hypothetical protein